MNESKLQILANEAGFLQFKRNCKNYIINLKKIIYNKNKKIIELNEIIGDLDIENDDLEIKIDDLQVSLNEAYDLIDRYEDQLGINTIPPPSPPLSNF